MTKKRGCGVRCNSIGTFSNKKGQITIFIIIGIIIVFVFAAILFLTKTTVKDSLDASAEPIIASVPQTFQPIKTYTENCLTQTGKQGLILLGEQGGYIKVDRYVSGRNGFDASNPTESDGIVFGSVQIPYWYHNENPNPSNAIALRSQKPELHKGGENSDASIESQLADYVTDQLSSCLNNYFPFQEQGFQIKNSDIEAVDVAITSNSVNFFLDMPLNVEKGNSKAEFNRFFIKIPLRLQHYYDAASIILDAQMNHSFLETQAIDLIHMFSGIDNDKLPPTTATDVELVPTVSWNVIGVKNDLKSILSSYVPMLRFAGSNNFYRYEYPVSDLSGLYQQTSDNMVLPLTGAEDLEVTFDYFGWEPYLELNDVGGQIKPQHYPVQYWMLNFAFQEYYNSYDLSYPVLVTVRDPSALDNQGYTFSFALETNLRNNRAMLANEVLPPKVVATQSLVCDERHRNTKIIRAVVKDSSTNEGLDNVNLAFTIPNQDDCVMGLTNLDGVLEENYPAVYGGVLNLAKEGYLTNYYPIDTYEYKESPGFIGYAIAGYPERVIEMHPEKEITLSVETVLVEKCVNGDCFLGGASRGTEVKAYKPELTDKSHKWYLTNSREKLSPAQTATITLSRVADLQPGVLSQDFATAATFNGNEKVEVGLYPGIYEVSGFLIDDVEIVIPEEERCSGGVFEALGCQDLSGCCYTLDEIRMEKYNSGFIDWTTESTYLKITPDQLYGSDELIFRIPMLNLERVPQSSGIRVLEDIQIMGELGEISQRADIKSKLKPQFR